MHRTASCEPLPNLIKDIAGVVKALAPTSRETPPDLVPPLAQPPDSHRLPLAHPLRSP